MASLRWHHFEPWLWCHRPRCHHPAKGALRSSPLSYRERAIGQPRSRHARYAAMAPQERVG